MRIAYYTSALGDYISGGIGVIVHISNELIKLGHNVCCFVDTPPATSNWLKAHFPVYMSDSEEYRKFDGILVSPFSPTAQAVSEHKNARDRFYHVNTMEDKFTYNGPEWTQQAIDSYSLPLKLFCTSNYVRILMEMQFNRRVIGTLVPPGYDPGVFYPSYKDKHGKLRVLVFGRSHPIRGVDVASEGIRQASQNISIEFRAIPDGIRDRKAVAEYYRWADVFIDTSRLAGSPTPVKEAMICGAVPICTPYGTTDFVLDHENGLIVPPDDPEEVCNALCSLSSNSNRHRMRDNAIRVMQEYTWEHIADRFLQAIQEGQRRTDLLEPKQW